MASYLSSCCGRKAKRRDDTEPLLPQHDDDTARQRALHEKLHGYQMLRALSKGYMPSTEQTITHLRTLLASDILSPNNEDLSESGRLLIRHCRTWLKLFIELLCKKNNKDQIQDFIWYLSKSRISPDVNGIIPHDASKAHRADARATYASFRTIGSLLVANSDFRLFVNDVATIGRQVLADSAFSLAEAADQAGKHLELSETEQQSIQGPGADEDGSRSIQELKKSVHDTSQTVGQAVAEVGTATIASAEKNFAGKQSETVLYRLQQTILKLRQRPDYAESVSTLAKLMQRYAGASFRAVDATITTVEDDILADPALDRATRNFWDLLSSFGDPEAWEQLEKDFHTVLSHARSDPRFEKFMVAVGNTTQDMLMDPEFFDNVDQKMDELRQMSATFGDEPDFRTDFDKLLRQAQRTITSVVQDKDINSLVAATRRIYNILAPPSHTANPDLITDAIHIFLPLLIRSVQYIPIPRVEVSVPEMDLLLENLVLEPGRNVNNTSFLPYRLLVSSKSDLEIRKVHSKRTTSSATSLLSITVNGLSVAAQDLGFWVRGHTGLVHFADEGIASFYLDERGIDISLDLEIGREKLEQILALRGVRVHIHKLDYTLRKSKLSWLGWLFKPFLKHLIRRSLEKTLAEGIVHALHTANRELVYARERLRATRIADPQDIVTFVKAVATRLTPGEVPDRYTRVGVDAPKKGVFQNVYTPQSVVKVWHEEALRAEEAVQDGEERGAGWRNNIFDVGLS